MKRSEFMRSDYFIRKNIIDTITQQILEYLQTIPKGKVATYKSIADRFCVHPRKVAAVMRYNKHPDIYPCYKVVSAS